MHTTEGPAQQATRGGLKLQDWTMPDKVCEMLTLRDALEFRTF